MNRRYWLILGFALALLPAVASAGAYWEHIN